MLPPHCSNLCSSAGSVSNAQHLKATEVFVQKTDHIGLNLPELIGHHHCGCVSQSPRPHLTEICPHISSRVCFMESWNHRLIEWHWLEGTFKSSIELQPSAVGYEPCPGCAAWASLRDVHIVVGVRDGSSTSMGHQDTCWKHSFGVCLMETQLLPSYAHGSINLL